MNLVNTARKSRIRTLAAVLAVAGSALGATVAQPAAADAAEFHTSVACQESATPVASHTCLANELPAAYFESTVTVTYAVCLEAPDQEVSCSEEGYAEAGRLYFNPITATEVGTYAVTWWVGEVEVGYWRFRVEPAASSGSSSSTPSPESPMPAATTGLATAPGLELESGLPSQGAGAPGLGAAPTTTGPACRAADKRVIELMGELKHASKKQVHGLGSKLRAAKAKARKAC